MFLLQLLVGLVMLVGGAELLVRGGSHIALALRVPVLIVGLTLVAFGTSAPELSVSVTAALKASTDMALANVNGSNIANIALVLGLAALVSPMRVDRRMMRREVPTLLVLSAAVPLLCLDGQLNALDGLLLIFGGLFYNAWLVRDAMKQRDAYDPEEDFDVDLGETKPARDIAMLVGGLVILVFGADQFIVGATEVAQRFGMSDRVIGLTVIALGTSAPEVATSVVSAYRGESDLAMGNAIGSNILNIAMVLGVTACIEPIVLHNNDAYLDMGIVFGAVLLLIPIVLRGSGRMGRVDGAVLVLAYLGYVGMTAL